MEDIERIVNYVFTNEEEFTQYYLVNKCGISSSTVYRIRNQNKSIDTLSWSTIKKTLVAYNNKMNS